ncbi:MAG TPA: twin-arginine translocation signal domain-containing protein [Kouleothrix sp.]|nr:twin-arginine translocation signal domain-containing protein [Kouleothrix sp.]HRC74937.1 twin-arginine translocation signal domain-containing protein [Kouleothrix sp.]
MDQQHSAISRRQFLKAGAGLGGALALGMSLRPIASHAQSLKIAGAKEVPSVCPYCAVGCGTLISLKDGQVINIEGNPDSPINRGTLCPKGAASFQLAVNPLRSKRALYRRPGAAEWEPIELGKAMDMIAERVKQTRDATFVETVTAKDADGNDVQKKANHTLGIFSLGGATMDNEWNYAQLKLLRGLGVVAIENQARI